MPFSCSSKCCQGLGPTACLECDVCLIDIEREERETAGWHYELLAEWEGEPSYGKIWDEVGGEAVDSFILSPKDQEILDAISALRAQSLVRKVETENVTAYWVGNLLRVDIKGENRSVR